MVECSVALEDARLAALHGYDVLDTAPEEAFDRITRLAKTVLQVPVVLVSLIDADRQWFKSRQGMEVSETPRSTSFCTHAIRQDEPLIVPDAAKDPRFRDNPFVTGDFGLRFYIGVPLVNRDGFKLGTLCCMDRVPRQLSDMQVAVLQDLARLVVDELELRRLATTDALTGAMARRAFLEAATRDVARAGRHGRPLCFAMVDADHFKAVNDGYGHPAGDRVLQTLVSICKAQLRVSDYIGRLGGEEFGIVLAETGVQPGFEVLQRLRAAIADTPVETAKGTIRVTVSAGLAGIDGGVTTIGDLMARADAALYRAKASGRDRVTIHADASDPVRLQVA